MQACTVTAVHCRPSAAFTTTRPTTSRFQPALVSRRHSGLVCRAEEQSGNAPASGEETAAPQQQQAAPPPPPMPPMPDAPWNRQPSQIDMQAQPDALGPIGNFFMAVLLIALCAGSFFTTVGRAFGPDMVPLSPEEMALMQDQ